jgi:hypothetical protein
VNIFVVGYKRKFPNRETWGGMIVGYYSSMQKAEEAIERSRLRPGFRDYPEGFYVTAYKVDADYDCPVFFIPWGLDEKSTQS